MKCFSPRATNGIPAPVNPFSNPGTLPMMKIFKQTYGRFADRVMRRALPTASALLAPLAALAVDPADSGHPPASPDAPPLNFQVLQTRRINLGNRSVILNRVAPPILPPAPAPPLPPPEPILTLEQQQALTEREAKKSAVLFLSATVYDHQVTVLRWSDENGSYRAYSNIDFTYLCGLGEIQTADAVYMLTMGLGEDSRAEILAFNSSITPEQAAAGLTPMEVPPAATDFSPTRAEYLVVEDPTHPVADAACAAIDALHVYFDAHKQRLIEDHAKRMAARLAKEKWDKEHPPIPKDTVINFWPEKSTVYPTTPSPGTAR